MLVLSKVKYISIIQTVYTTVAPGTNRTRFNCLEGIYFKRW